MEKKQFELQGEALVEFIRENCKNSMIPNN